MKRNKQTNMQKLRCGKYHLVDGSVCIKWNRMIGGGKFDPLCSLDRWIRTGVEQSRNLVFKKKLKPKSWYWVKNCKENWHYVMLCWTRSYE